MAASVQEHAAHVAAHLALSWHAETLPLDEALGRVTATAALSPVDLPMFRNSQMDGYAIQAADASSAPVTLAVAGHLAAAPAEPAPLAAGTAVRIMTGAVVPDGADAIIPVEDTRSTDTAVTVLRPVRAGEYVGERGSDLGAGAQLLPAGLRLAPRHLAALAAAGLTRIEVRSRVKVAVISTGTELVPPGSQPRPGQLFDSNGTALVAALREAGAEVIGREHVDDEPARMLAALTSASAADVIVTSGGISMGDHEVVREVLGPRGGRFGHVAMQPGGPQGTGRFDGVPVLCFPGNPVSTQLSFEVFLAPLLREFAGLPARVTQPRVLAGSVTSPPGKRQFLRGRDTADGRVEVSASGSHLVAGLAASDRLVIVPEEVTSLREGDTVETWAL